MPVRIKVLPEDLANKIAAGEVVERPASVVKELAENALDAGATRVFIDVQAGGTKLISISDDGSGMGPDDALLSLERHGTSKLKDISGLESILSLGFRGEAIPSIASVSRFRMTTSEGNGPGTLISVEGGRLSLVKEVGAAKGTIVEIRDLFFNTPARLKFMKSVETEFGHIAATVEKLALVNNTVHFRLTHNDREALDCPPVNYPRDRVAQVYGSDFARGMVELERRDGPVAVGGFISGPGMTYSDKARQETFVNGRPVKDPVITRALYDAYRSVLMKDRHPASILFITVDPTEVDVNVHPAKREVRFARPQDIHRAVFDAVTSSLRRMDEDGDTDGTTETADTAAGYRDRVREATESYLASQDSRSASDYGDSGRDRFPRAGAGAMPRQESMRLPKAGFGAHGVQPQVHAQPQHAYNAPTALQVADTYIILPSEDGYIVIDQHAAHERVQYERIKARLGGHGTASQGLLVPVQLDLTAKEAALMRGILPELAEMGIEIDEFGGGSFIIRSKPLFLEKTDVKEAVMGVLAEVGESDVKAGADGLKEKVYQLMACKSAVKAGQRLHPEAINRLVKQLFDCKMPYTCAHGRPTVVRFGLAELDKMFRRK